MFKASRSLSSRFGDWRIQGSWRAMVANRPGARQWRPWSVFGWACGRENRHVRHQRGISEISKCQRPKRFGRVLKRLWGSSAEMGLTYLNLGNKHRTWGPLEDHYHLQDTLVRGSKISFGSELSDETPHLFQISCISWTLLILAPSAQKTRRKVIPLKSCHVRRAFTSSSECRQPKQLTVGPHLIIYIYIYWFCPVTCNSQ